MKYWVYLNGEVPGSFEPQELARIHDFSDASMVCPAEGSVADRNWQRAGLFPDIVKALESQRSRPPLADPDPKNYLTEISSFPINPDKILGETSQRLFNHVTSLMQELNLQREERALTQSLEKALAQTKNELSAARDRIRFLEDQVSLIPGYEDREQRLQEFLGRAKAEIKERETVIADQKRTVDDARHQMGEARRQAAEVGAENKNLERWVNDLNQRLADKELELAKALSVLQRLDQELSLINRPPRATVQPQAEAAPPAPVAVKPATPKAPSELTPLAGAETEVSNIPAPEESASRAVPISTPQPQSTIVENPAPAEPEPAWLRLAAYVKNHLFPH